MRPRSGTSPRPGRTLARTLGVMALVALAPGAAWPAEEPPGVPRPVVRAAAREGPIAVDGRLDEPAWRAAEPFDAFVQQFPIDGAPPGERTEVRVLLDGERLHVGVTCQARRPEAVARPMGRRDHPPASDTVEVLVASGPDGRTALGFTVTAGGVLLDRLYYDDDQSTTDWDGVWEGAAALTPEGWSAELSLPLSLFRLDGVARGWGFGVRREAQATHEVDTSFPLPRSARGLVSRLGRLTGLTALAPGASLEVTPYAMARLVLRPQYGWDARPEPRLADPGLDLGLDLTGRLGPSLRLTATVNPDFGQVEADQILLNLTTYETFRPEKRPFFTQDLGVFQPVGAGREDVPQQLVYSRRIGLDTPILAAAKLTGQGAPGLEIGLLDALVDAASLPAGFDPDHPDRGLGVRLEQPLHVGPADAAPPQEPLAQNFLAAVARWRAAERLVLGATATSVLPFGPDCTAAEAARDAGPSEGNPAGPFQPRRCTARSGQAAALDLDVRSADLAWGAYGQVGASLATGGPPGGFALPDGQVLRDGTAGWGGYLTAGRLGGEPVRFTVHLEYASPTFDLNAAGYQRTQNVALARGELRFTRPTGGGPFLSYDAYLQLGGSWTTDGRGLDRGRFAYLGWDALLRDPYLNLGCIGGYEPAAWDVRALGAGAPLEKPPLWYADCWGNTDPARAIGLSWDTKVGAALAQGPLGGPPFASASATLTVRPAAWLETQLGVTREWNGRPDQRVDDRTPSAGPRQFLLAELDGPTLSFTLRQLVAVSRQLTFQLYAQLFTAYQRYGPFWTASSDGAPVALDALAPVDSAAAGWSASYDRHRTELAVNAVLRWEYRPGSTLYAVWARTQREPQLDGVPGSPSLAPAGLGAGPTTDTFLVKCAYAFAP